LMEGDGFPHGPGGEPWLPMGRSAWFALAIIT